jgi:hypothetical protein
MSLLTVDNLELVLEVLGALSVAAAIVAKATKNTKDDTYVAKFKKFLDFVSLSKR